MVVGLRGVADQDGINLEKKLNVLVRSRTLISVFGADFSLNEAACVGSVLGSQGCSLRLFSSSIETAAAAQ